MGEFKRQGGEKTKEAIGTTQMISKQRNRLLIQKQGNLKLYLTKMSPNISKLCEGCQAHPSHWIGSGCVSIFLTPWELGYDILIPRNQPKTSSCQLPYQRHSSSADCARELFKPLKDLVNLLVCTRKKIFSLGLWIFYD